jgi:hypothetical protein
MTEFKLEEEEGKEELQEDSTDNNKSSRNVNYMNICH